MEIQYAFLFFISGAVLTIIYSRLVGLYHGVKLFQDIEKYVSVYIVLNKKMVETFLESRRKIASASLPKDEIESMHQSDLMLMDVFKKSILVINKNSYPNRYLGNLKYRTWEELEQYAKDTTEENKRP
tara:strand:+ start:249 stop:632 length:384 start_codon:yes stop_codon:yes gene_type:complete